MNRRHLIRSLAATPFLGTLSATAQAAEGTSTSDRLALSAADWRRRLPADRHAILFQEATEPAFSSPLNDEKRDGTYVCAACRQPLFEAKHKYDSGTGWPSFTQPIAGALGTKRDYKLIWPRTEYHCARCGGHQGHVFDDGPEPRGERWCNNGLALEFVPAGEPLPALVQ